MTSVRDRAARVYDYMVLHPELPLRKSTVENALGMGHGSTMARVWRVVSQMAQTGGWCLTPANPADENTLVLTRDPDKVVNGHLFVSAIRAGVQKREQMTGAFIASAPADPGSDAEFVAELYNARQQILATVDQLEDSMRQSMIARRRRERHEENGTPPT
jgi:hypothetical protein